MTPASTPVKHLLTLIVIAATLLALSSCRSAQLQAVETTVATLKPTLGEEVSRTTQDKGAVFGKPAHAEISVDYRPKQGQTVDDVYAEVIALLEQQYWVREEFNPAPGQYSASLVTAQETLLVSVLIRPEDDLVNLRLVNTN